MMPACTLLKRQRGCAGRDEQAPALVCHLKRPPPRRVLDALHRQPNRLRDRGVEVGDADRAVLDLSTPSVRLPIRLPAPDPRPSQQARERLVVVVPPSLPLIRGVRPNSVPRTTSVSSGSAWAWSAGKAFIAWPQDHLMTWGPFEVVGVGVAPICDVS